MSKMDRSVSKMGRFVSRARRFVSKTRRFETKVGLFVFKVGRFVSNGGSLSFPEYPVRNAALYFKKRSNAGKSSEAYLLL